MAYNFERALQNGETEDSIRLYLDQKGRSAEADAFFQNSKPSRSSLAQRTANQPLEDEKRPGFFSRVGEAWKRRAGNIEERVDMLQRGRQGSLSTALQVVGQGAAGVTDTLFEAGREAYRVALPRAAEDAVANAGEAILQTPIGQEGLQLIQAGSDKYSAWRELHPVTARNLEAVVNIGSLVPAGMGAKALAKTTAEVAEGMAKGTVAVARGTTAIPAAAGKGTRKAQLYLSKSNVNEQVPTSAGRLKDPVTLYNEFFEQEKKFKADGKQDMASGLAASRLGQAFDSVVEQRRSVGARVGEELKKPEVGNVKTDLTPYFTKLEDDLFENEALAFDAKKGKLVSLSRENKMTAEDTGLLESYITSLNKLGADPTVSELDAFLRRVPADINIYKKKNNITGVSNGERLVKKSLVDLREQFSPEVTKNPALTELYKARKEWSELTDFLDEGTSFLGKKTQSGDYKKDANLLKSAVTSMLNSGRKDWLMKLEELTGYNSIDEFILALQAMQDAGNPAGKSLLNILTDTESVPLSKGTVAEQLIRGGLGIAKKAFTGTPDQQTRRLLESLRDTPQKPIPAPKLDTKTTETVRHKLMELMDDPAKALLLLQTAGLLSDDQVDGVDEQSE